MYIYIYLTHSRLTEEAKSDHKIPGLKSNKMEAGMKCMFLLRLCPSLPMAMSRRNASFKSTTSAFTPKIRKAFQLLQAPEQV